MPDLEETTETTEPVETADFTPATLDDVLSDDAPETVVEARPPVTEPAAEAPAVEPAANEPADDGKPKDWSYAAYSAEKEKRQAAEKRLVELEAQEKAREYQAKANAVKAEVPDVLNDPKAYEEHIKREAMAPVLGTVRALQRQVATTAHGAEKVTAAEAWFNTLPDAEKVSIETACFATDDPFGALIAQQSKAKLIAEIGEDPEAYKARIIAEHLASGAPLPTQTQPAAPKSSQVKLNPSVMDAPSVAPRGKPVWAGPTPLGDILGD